MEPDPRAAPGAHRLRPVNAPQPVQVRTGDAGAPRALLVRGSWRRCARIEEVWRVEEGWWRPKPVRRTYFRLALEDGLLLTVYLDDLEGSWWSQRY